MHELAGAVSEIVGTVCSTVLGLESELHEGLERPPGALTMVGCVQITGTWCGAVLLQCSPEFASKAARIIFASEGTPSPEDERDALGELSNMVAGNLKALLPSPSFLALPTISEGIDHVLEVLGSRVVDKFELLVAGEQLTVVVVMRQLSLPVPGV